MTEVLLRKCACCCLTTAVTTGAPVFHTLKVTLTKGMPGKVTLSSQQSLTSSQRTERWLLLSPNPSQVPADSPGNCTQGTKAKTDRQTSSQSSCQGLSEVGPPQKGALLNHGARILNALAPRSLLLLSFGKGFLPLWVQRLSCLPKIPLGELSP